MDARFSRRSSLALVAVAAAVLALLGMPRRTRLGPRDELRVALRSVDGAPLAGVSVALFDARTSALVATRRTDSLGHVTFANAPESADVVAVPDAASGFAPRWRRCVDVASSRGASIALSQARPLRVRVRDARGTPVVGARVRVYERDLEPVRRAAVIAAADTDSEGCAVLLATERVHVGVLPRERALASEWAFDVAVAPGGTACEVELDDAVVRRARVVGADGLPLPGVVVGSWSAGEPREWHGFAASGPDGELALALDARGARLHAVDPLGRAVANAFDAPAVDEPLLVRLGRGRAVEVRCADAGGRPVAASLRLRDADTGAWGWSFETGRGGSARALAPEAFDVAARPASRIYSRALVTERSPRTEPLVLVLPRALNVAATPQRRRGG